MSKYACRDCDTTFTAPTDTDTVRCPGCGDMVEQQPAVSSPPPDQTAEPVCLCGHPMRQHHEDVCLTECGCQDGREPEAVLDLPDRLEAALTARFTESGNPFSRMRIAFQGPDGWPASKEVGPHDVALVLRELLAAAPAVPPPADRAAVLLEARDVARAEAERLEMSNHDARAARGARSVAYLLRRLAAEAQQQPDTETRPRRGDQFEAWLKAQRDAAADYPEAYQATDGLLDLYRLHADTGTPLDQHACEGKHCDCPPAATEPDPQPVSEEFLQHLATAKVREDDGAEAQQPDTETCAALATARATNQRLNYEKQRLESELAAYRRAVCQWDIGERGTYISLASLRAIGLAGGRDILGSVRHLKHFQRVEQAEAAIGRVRQLHDRLAEETDLASPDDSITRGAAAKRIAAALDGWNPTGAPQCDVEFENGARCAKPAGHRPPGSDDPHVPEPRPRCPHCNLPHDLDPASGVPAACASILASLADRDAAPAAAGPGRAADTHDDEDGDRG